MPWGLNVEYLKSVANCQCDAGPTVTFPSAELNRPLTCTKLYCRMTKEHECEHYLLWAVTPYRPNRKWNPRRFDYIVRRPTHYVATPVSSIAYNISRTDSWDDSTLLSSNKPTSKVLTTFLEWFVDFIDINASGTNTETFR